MTNRGFICRLVNPICILVNWFPLNNTNWKKKFTSFHCKRISILHRPHTWNFKEKPASNSLPDSLFAYLCSCISPLTAYLANEFKLNPGLPGSAGLLYDTASITRYTLSGYGEHGGCAAVSGDHSKIEFLSARVHPYILISELCYCSEWMEINFNLCFIIITYYVLTVSLIRGDLSYIYYWPLQLPVKLNYIR